ncbi:MAG: hypothetical protein HKO57_13920, partial [Akkermansiaceae bacterium]|nr:hypothetical protein [Akkermansiaceae bacterium]
VMPVEAGLDRLSKEIMAGGRTYSVFDLAKLVLGARDRFNVNFKTNDARKLILCRRDGSVWLDRNEAIRHLWRADWFGDCYEEVVKDVGPPKGNFQAVAKCGMSGELLGPPNYHGYQAAIAALHRERFGHMSLDQYKRRIEMDRSEEAVAAWLDRMSKRIQYRPRSGKPAPPAAAAEETAPEAPPADAPAAPEESAAPETAAPEESAAPGEAAAVAEDPPAEGAGEAAPAGDGDGAEPAAEESSSGEESASDAVAEEAAAPDEAAGPPPDDEPLLADRKDVERHFKEHFFKMLYQETDRAWVPGDIPGNRLSPGLLTLLRATVAEERRYPGRLTPILCRQMSGRHVAVFKWRKKLKAGPSRPHPIPSDISIADRPRKLLEWVQAKSGANLEALWKDLLPAEADDKTKHEWYHDLHWLLNQGYVLLLGDSSLHIAKREGPPARSKAAAGKAGGKPKQAEKRGKGPRKRRRRKRAKGRPGLYAWSSMTTAGEPKLQRALTSSGLWPLDSRMNAVAEPEEAAEDDGGEPLRRIWRDLI